jgi:hypothetical protein
MVGVALAVACRPRAPEPAPPEEEAPPLFRDVTAESGVNFTYRNGEEKGHLSILESLGGGVALLDYDGDGLLDVFVTGGGYFAGQDGKEVRGHPCALYRNLGGGKFEDVTKKVGLDKLAGGRPWFYTHGAAVADFDRDGRPDLLVTGWGRVALFRNVDGRRFVDVTEEVGLDRGITWATGAGWADLDGDGYPDLYVCQYVDWSWGNHPRCDYDRKTADVCPPRQFNALPHKVYHNVEGKRGRRFADVSASAGLVAGGKGLGVLLVDVDGDGRPDVYVANDTTGNFLYINRSTKGHIHFEEQGALAGVARDDRSVANGSMGVDAGDYDGSGRPSLWVTNYENELHALYRNHCEDGQVFFNFQTCAAGIAAIGQKYVGWGTAFIDPERDGWEGLLVVNGHAIRYPHTAPRRQRPVLLLNRQGGEGAAGRTFHEATRRLGAYGLAEHLARGLALGDLDNDGRVGAVISHVNEPVTLLRGEPPADTGWLGVQLAGKGHADVVGARAVLEVAGRKLTRFAKGGGSYASSGDHRLFFGLGRAKEVGRLTVVWPDRSREHFDGLAPGHYYRITQGAGRAEPLPARRRA